MNTYIHVVAYSTVAILALTSLGNYVCRGLFYLTKLTNDSSAPDQSDKKAANAGRIIGSLERIIIAVGIISHSWEMLAAVIALKTISRFKELDQKEFAEYFLVGSLFSILWAALITGIWLYYDQFLGVNLRDSFAIVPQYP